MSFDIISVMDTAREAERQGAIPSVTADGREFLIDKAGQIVWLTNKEEAPQYIKGNTILSEAASLAAYVARFRETSTPMMIAAISDKAVIVTLDYPTSAGPTRMAHRACWKLAESVEFKAWTSVAGKSMTQEEANGHLEAMRAVQQTLYWVKRNEDQLRKLAPQLMEDRTA
jgi:uncharacterized membrane protein